MTNLAFENFKLNLETNLFLTDIFTDKANDRINFFYNKKLQELGSDYQSFEEISKFSEKLNKETFSIFQLNI